MIGSSSLYQYDPASQILSLLTDGREFIRMESLPDGSGVLLTEESMGPDGQRLLLWRDGRLFPYDPNDDQLGASGGATRAGSLLARPATQNEIVARSNDGRWMAELGDSSLVLSAPDDGFRRVVAHGGRDCRGLAWVQVGVGDRD
jgi:glucose/arabinose dehydrogenase